MFSIRFAKFGITSIVDVNQIDLFLHDLALGYR